MAVIYTSGNFIIATDSASGLDRPYPRKACRYDENADGFELIFDFNVNPPSISILFTEITAGSWTDRVAVPYTEATMRTFLQDNTAMGEMVLGVSNVEWLSFNTAVTPSGGVAKLEWNDTDGTLNLGLKGGTVSLQIGQEIVARVVNKTGADLLEAEYKAVYIDGAVGNRLKVALADNTAVASSTATLGIVTETILNNGEGFITISGLVREIDTTGTLQGETWIDGDILYLGTSGDLTNIAPTGSAAIARIGFVVRSHATQGAIFVKVLPSFRIAELNDVVITGVEDIDLVQYDALTGRWVNGSDPGSDLFLFSNFT